ncbi:MAG: cell division protein ZapE [Magnetococcales bacterium]|nr:cell division protein ZapE [Magnetococcales bacterium]
MTKSRTLLPDEPVGAETESPVDLPSRHWYKALAQGIINKDPVQETLLPLLDQVVTDLNAPVQRVPWRGVEVWRAPTTHIPTAHVPVTYVPATHGVYLYGEVGRGKSLLMQMIFDSVSVTEKRRVHFHPFMEELHQRMHHSRPPKNVDWMLYVASQLSAEARLLCFDEFYITTIADGILLGRLLEALFYCGVTLCATSNWAPDHLFQDGFNRSSVLPFIALLKKRIHVCELGHGVDWRRQTPPSDKAAATPEGLFTHLTKSRPHPTSILLRHVPVPVQGMANGVFWFEFTELCSRTLGRAEYMNLCNQARAVIISGLHKLSADGADMAMRFVVLVDLLYEHQIPLQIYSHLELEEICQEGPAAFAWRRSVSRIHELSRLHHSDHE